MTETLYQLEEEEPLLSPEEELHRAKELRHVFRKLLEHQGWAALVSFWEGQIEQKQRSRNQIAASVDALIAKEHTLVEMAMIRMVLDFPKAMLESFTEDIEHYTTIVENAND